ncbi:phage integrase N-terminal SAM-like domain-containing protein [Azomonas agilis]
MLNQGRAVIRMCHYSLRTEHSYCDWICRFIRFHLYRHPTRYWPC